MLINYKDQDTTSHVGFVEYTGKWPNLCGGMLTLLIDGKTVKFGNKYMHKDADYEKFWSSGGSCSLSGTCENEWNIDVSELPEEYRKYAVEIDTVFNENVEFGCCGGCK